MKINQLSVFLENRPGKLEYPCRVLADAKINILTLSLADTRQFGIMRLIVHDWQAAHKALEGAGCVVKTTEVIGIEVPDRPGGLAEVLRLLEEAGLNVEYMYAFTSKSLDGKAIMVFRFDDPDAALERLRSHEIAVVDSTKLFERLES